MTVWESGRESSLLDAIIDGRKTVEGRLNRGKFKDYRPGDYVWLRRDYRQPDGTLVDGEPRQALVRIIEIRTYPSFLDLVANEGHESVIPGSGSVEAAAAEYDKYYSHKEQKEFGVLAVHIAVADPSELPARN